MKVSNKSDYTDEETNQFIELFQSLLKKHDLDIQFTEKNIWGGNKDGYRAHFKSLLKNEGSFNLLLMHPTTDPVKWNQCLAEWEQTLKMHKLVLN